MSDEEIDTKFARYHMIPLSYAYHYRQGREHYRAGKPYRYPLAPSPEEGWFFAGYADSDIHWRTKK